MTTLEVVEAVQRSLENEGFLQLIRAQLRSNVLRIISSGPEYSPQTGKSVELSHRQQGVIALQLVRQLLEQYNLRESLAVLEAEAGLNEENYLDRRSLKDKLNIHTADDESVLEGLVVSALQSREKRNDANDVQQSLQDRADVVYPASVDVPAESKDDDLDSVPEEESVVEEEEDDVAYSQIEDRDTVESREQSRVSSAASSPVKAVAASKDDGDSPLQLDAKHLSSLNSSGAKSSPTPAALHPSFHGHGSKQLDVSSSFEADSPARSQASHVAQQKMNAVVLEDSFAEEPEEEDEEFSVEEEIEEEEVEEREDSMAKEEDEREEKELAKAVSPAMSPDRDTKRDDSRSLSGKEEEGEEQGPEYDSDHSSHSAAEAKKMSQERAQIGHKGDSSKHSDSDSSMESAGGKAAPSSLRPAVADDFDPTDRSAADHSLSSSSSNRNRVAVRRAAMEAAESKNSADSNAPGAKANVFRLGQSSISRSQLGWGSETSAHAVDDDRSEDEDDDEFAATEKGARNGGGTATASARYTATSQMEAVSFDTDEDDGDRPSPVRAEPRRSNNQESESEGEHDRNESKDKNKDNNSSRESAHSADFETEEDSEGDVSFGDDEDVLPSVGKGVPARTAFGSPPTKSASRAEKEEEDEGDDADEYGDDDFVEDEEEEEENEPQQKPVQRQAPTTGGGLFSTRAGTIPNKALSSNHDDEDEEEDEEGSVEEEIEEEVEEDMSVGDLDSDEDDDGGFGSPVQAKKKVNQQQQQQSLGDGLFRAGRSGPLPGVSSVAATKGKASHFDSILNSDDSSDSESESNRKGSAGVSKRGASSGPGISSITDRMREIDSQLEELEHDDPHLAKLKNHSDDENSVASEDIDAMEFSTGGGQDNDSESSGEGSFSFLDASTKK